MFQTLPKHVCIIMDGNGRWAKQRGLPRIAGHSESINTVRGIVREAGKLGIEVLSLFAFSSENWMRPPEEVSGLMKLFAEALQDEVAELHQQSVQLTILGDIAGLPSELQQSIDKAHAITCNNTGLKLVIFLNYGGRWDLTQAMRSLAKDVQNNKLSLQHIDEASIQSRLTTSKFPDPDLLIRTSDEHRISNFLLWQLAYTELYFSEVMWPDFSIEHFHKAIQHYGTRTRRFGYTDEQIQAL